MFARRIYDLLTSDPLKRAFKSVAKKFPAIDIVVRKVQVLLFDLFASKQRVILHRDPSCTNMLFVDVSFLVLEDHKTGIQRVVRSILLELQQQSPAGYAIQPVYADPHFGYRPAQLSTGIDQSFSLTKSSGLHTISICKGDIFLGLDFACTATLREAEYLSAIRNEGVKVCFVIYDLLPVQFPQYFTPSSEAFHSRWLKTLSQFDGVICISQTVANQYRQWLNANNLNPSPDFRIDYFHLGADIQHSAPTKGLLPDHAGFLQLLRQRPTFLMVSTLEPRKGYGLILNAFTELWREGKQTNLVIVGKAGWNIDALILALHNHPEFGQRLFWLEGVSDESLEQLYAASACLIVASEGEGFGLPIIEAAKHGLPVLLRDIPVFREVAGQAATYFKGESTQDTAEAIAAWMEAFQAGTHIKSDAIQYNTWKQSVEQMIHALLPTKTNR